MNYKEEASKLIDKMANINKMGARHLINKESTKIAALISIEFAIQKVYDLDHKSNAVYNKETQYWDYDQSKELRDLILIKEEIIKQIL